MARDLVYYPSEELIKEPLFKLSSIDEMPASLRYSVKINGECKRVFCTEVFHYAPAVVADGEVNVEITVNGPFGRVQVRPSNLGIEPVVEGQKISFKLNGAQKVSVELDGDLKSALFVLCTPYIEKPADATYCYEKGNIYNVGVLSLKTGDTVYIEEGAVVLGRITANRADNISIIGNGILCGTPFHKPDVNNWQFLVDLRWCKNVRIEGITEVDSPSWMLVPAACDNVLIKNVSSLSVVVTGDGMDLCGSQDVVVEDCFVRAADDCICIKATRLVDHSTVRDVKNILVQNCVVWNAEPGNGLEIGYECECREISDVTFRNCDVIHCELEGNMGGAAMGIHLADCAHVHDIHYEDIRVEDAQQKLFDLKVLDCKYTTAASKGNMDHIYFKDIKVLNGPRPVSQIRGCDRRSNDNGTDWGAGECRPRNIFFENIEILGERCKSVLDIGAVVEMAHDISVDGKIECIQRKF